jgi:DNA-binding MarR family transcriptional regulator
VDQGEFCHNRPIPLTEARVMTEINVRNGGTATEIREFLGIDRGYMSRIIQKFEEESIIFKEQSTDDASIDVTSLTTSLFDMVSTIFPTSIVAVSIKLFNASLPNSVK